MRARVYLRQPLFTYPGSQGHVPAGTMVIEGECAPAEGIGLRVDVTTYFDEKGRKLEGTSRTLIVAAGKLDHLQPLD
jgi:hypothetical protein